MASSLGPLGWLAALPPARFRHSHGHEVTARFHAGYGYVTRLDTYLDPDTGETIRVRTTGVAQLREVFRRRSANAGRNVSNTLAFTIVSYNRTV